jgi:hypothetical protein
VYKGVQTNTHWLQELKQVKLPQHEYLRDNIDRLQAQRRSLAKVPVEMHAGVLAVDCTGWRANVVLPPLDRCLDTLTNALLPSVAETQLNLLLDDIRVSRCRSHTCLRAAHTHTHTHTRTHTHKHAQAICARLEKDPTTVEECVLFLTAVDEAEASLPHLTERLEEVSQLFLLLRLYDVVVSDVLMALYQSLLSQHQLMASLASHGGHRTIDLARQFGCALVDATSALHSRILSLLNKVCVCLCVCVCVCVCVSVCVCLCVCVCE